MAAESIYKGMSLTECIYACMHHLQSYNSSGMNLSGSSFVVGVLFAAAIASTAALRSCDSRLRILLPHLFKHCDCIYSDWSEWEQVPNSIGTDVSGTCESGQAFIETRKKMAIGEGCEEQDESRTTCKLEYARVHLHIQFDHCKQKFVVWEPVHCHNPKLTINLTCRCTNSEGQADIAAWFGRQINTAT